MESVVTDVGLNTRYGTTDAHRSVSPAESASRFCQRWAPITAAENFMSVWWAAVRAT